MPDRDASHEFSVDVGCEEGRGHPVIGQAPAGVLICKTLQVRAPPHPVLVAEREVEPVRPQLGASRKDGGLVTVPERAQPHLSTIQTARAALHRAVVGPATAPGPPERRPRGAPSGNRSHSRGRSGRQAATGTCCPVPDLPAGAAGRARRADNRERQERSAPRAAPAARGVVAELLLRARHTSDHRRRRRRSGPGRRVLGRPRIGPRCASCVTVKVSDAGAEVCAAAFFAISVAL